MKQDRITNSLQVKGCMRLLGVVRKAILWEEGPAEGSEGRLIGKVMERGRPSGWENSPHKNVEVAPSMAWVEDAWHDEGLRVDEVELR